MKKGICFSILPADVPLEQRMAMVAEAGYDGIEIDTLETASQRRAAKRAADAAGLEIHSVMASGHWAFPLSSPRSSVRRKGMDSIRRSVDTAAAVGADGVLVVPGVVNAEASYETAYSLALQSMQELAPHAVSAGVMLLVENVWNNFLLSPPEFVGFIDAVGNTAVQAYFDVGNIVAYGIPEQWIHSLRQRIRKLHAKGFDAATRSFVCLLEGTIDWKGVRKALRDIKYDGYITAEMPLYRYAPYADQMLNDVSGQLSRIITGK